MTSEKGIKQELELGKEKVQRMEIYDYLGVRFTHEGIGTSQHIAERTRKGMITIGNLARCGYNARGFSFAACTRIYRSFIRPVIDYALGVMPSLKKKDIILLKRTQKEALRRITGQAKNVVDIAFNRLHGVTSLTTR